MTKTIEKHAPLLMKIALFSIGIVVLFIMVFVSANIVLGIGDEDALWYIFPNYILFVLACIPTLYGIYLSLLLVKQVENNEFFTKVSILYLNRIKISAAIVGLIFLVETPLWFMIAKRNDAPGIILIMLFIAGLSFSISIFTILVQKNIYQANHN